MIIRWLQSWHRRRLLAGAKRQLEALRQGALSAPDHMVRDDQILSANLLLDDLQAHSVITPDERQQIAAEWIDKYIRACLPELYRDKNVAAIDRLGRLMQDGRSSRENHKTPRDS
jgi:hypothetical protein